MKGSNAGSNPDSVTHTTLSHLPVRMTSSDYTRAGRPARCVDLCSPDRFSMLDDRSEVCARGKSVGRTLHRQTTLPPVGRGPRLRRFAPFRSRSTPRASPPSSRGVCLVFSFCSGPLTTMTGSELAGHRLLEVLVASCSAPRSSHGGMAQGHPSNDPHRSIGPASKLQNTEPICSANQKFK